MSIATVRTASRQEGVACASQYAASSAVRPSTCPSSPWSPDRSKKQVCHRSASSTYSPVTASVVQRGRPRRCSSMPRCATGAGACSSTGPAAAANASWAAGQEIPACRAASAGVIPRSATSAPACSRSRAVSRHRGGTCGRHSVNVLRSQPGSSHFHRDLTHHTATWSPARRTSRGRASTVSCQPGRDGPAVRARRRGRVIGDRPYLQRAVRASVRIGDLQALHAEQHRRRILDHDARGFLMILILW